MIMFWKSQLSHASLHRVVSLFVPQNSVKLGIIFFSFKLLTPPQMTKYLPVRFLGAVKMQKLRNHSLAANIFGPETIDFVTCKCK